VQYKKLGGDLRTVQNFITRAAENAHIEVTSLIVPGLNDSEDEMKSLSKWLSNIDSSIPLHISRFFPNRNMSDGLPTDIVLLKKLSEIAKGNLERVYLGNV